MELTLNIKTIQGSITEEGCSLNMASSYGIGVVLKDSDKSNYESFIARLECSYYDYGNYSEIMDNLFGDETPSVLVKLSTLVCDIKSKEYCKDGLVLLLNNLMQLIPDSLALYCDEDDYYDIRNALRFEIHIVADEDSDYELIKSIKNKLNSNYIFNDDNKTLSILFLREV